MTLLLMCLTGESTLRLEAVQALIWAPNLGIANPEFGIKFARVETLFKKGETINCFFVGNSTIDTGVNPDAFESGYRAAGGMTPPHCFNFAISALPPVSLKTVVEFLIRRYHPQLIIYGIGPGAFSKAFDPVDEYQTPFTRFVSGEFSFAGWLMESSYIYRYSTLWPDIWVVSRRQFIPKRWPYTMLPNGHVVLSRTIDRNTDFSTVGGDPAYALNDKALASYKTLLSWSSSSLQILLVEEPLHPAVQPFFVGGSRSAYEHRFFEVLSAEAQLRQVPIFRTVELAQTLIPADGWQDITHLNFKGAPIFSEWLGQRVAETWAIK